MSSTSAVTKIIYDAFTDFCANAGTQSPEEWLQGYLGAKLPPQYVDTIHSISGAIIDTLDFMDKKKAAMEEAAADGKSAENWLASDIMAASGSNGSKARLAAAFFNGITSAEKSLDNNVETTAIDISENSELWQDDNWNDFKLKDTLKVLATEAGKAGLTEVASDVFMKASQDGIAATLTDSSFMKSTIASGSAKGLECAVAAGLQIAESNGLLPATSIKVTAIIAWKTTENMIAFVDVATGQATMTETLIMVKNNAVVTASGMWEQNKDQILTEVVDYAGRVYGIQGAFIAGAICGLLKDTNESTRWITARNEAIKATAAYISETTCIPLSVFNKALQLAKF